MTGVIEWFSQRKVMGVITCCIVIPEIILLSIMMVMMEGSWVLGLIGFLVIYCTVRMGVLTYMEKSSKDGVWLSRVWIIEAIILFISVPMLFAGAALDGHGVEEDFVYSVVGLVVILGLKNIVWFRFLLKQLTKKPEKKRRKG